MIVSTSKDGVCVELHGKEQLWSMRAKISVPRDTITDIRFEPRFNNWRKWEVRMPGTHAPKLLLAGSYWTEEGWDFMYIKHPVGFLKPRVSDVLVIETNQDRYKRVILSMTPDKAAEIVKWWGKKPASKAKPKAKPAAPKKPKKKRIRKLLRRKAK